MSILRRFGELTDDVIPHLFRRAPSKLKELRASYVLPGHSRAGWGDIIAGSLTTRPFGQAARESREAGYQLLHQLARKGDMGMVRVFTPPAAAGAGSVLLYSTLQSKTSNNSNQLTQKNMNNQEKLDFLKLAVVGTARRGLHPMRRALGASRDAAREAAEAATIQGRVSGVIDDVSSAVAGRPLPGNARAGWGDIISGIRHGDGEAFESGRMILRQLAARGLGGNLRAYGPLYAAGATGSAGVGYTAGRS